MKQEIVSTYCQVPINSLGFGKRFQRFRLLAARTSDFGWKSTSSAVQAARSVPSQRDLSLGRKLLSETSHLRLGEAGDGPFGLASCTFDPWMNQ
jgi:hypothetical protein